MPRPTILYSPKRVNISIDGDLHKQAQAYAKRIDMDFSEMLARLVVAELRSKKGIAQRFPRRIGKAAA